MGDVCRTRLPDRRPQETATLTWQGQRLSVSVGLDPRDGRARELFLSGARVDLQHVLDDASVIVSLALQHGVSLAALRASLARLPAEPVTPADLERPAGRGARRAASVIGAALDQALELVGDVDNA